MHESDFEMHATIGDMYRPAMEITDEEEARAYFEKCVRHGMNHGQSREEAEEIQRQNLGYFAGYYDNETRVRVERLFDALTQFSARRRMASRHRWKPSR